MIADKLKNYSKYSRSQELKYLVYQVKNPNPHLQSFSKLLETKNASSGQHAIKILILMPVVDYSSMKSLEVLIDAQFPL